ncbi:MAG: carboxypeptidase regulatory-like domain-containing protein [Myxococcales bacterium]|nr:carboxypeptidase regulatory-like domain-containing protein [Myxococcales bacterium]
MRCTSLPLAFALSLSLGNLSCNDVGLSGGDVGPMFSHPDIVSMGYEGCKNLQCRQVSCKNSKVTSISGRVNIPAGNLPIPGAYVYIPNSALKPITTGPSCERCDTLFSGEPVARTQTGLDGTFKLNNVPIGENVPLVVQVGKWRRQINVSYAEPCSDTVLPYEDTRLPRSQEEGNIPKIALATGGKDTLECLVRRLGIADSEFTLPSGSGRVNLYAGKEGTSAFSPTFNGGGMFPPAPSLWSNATTLNSYDMFIGSCEGGGTPNNETPQSIQNVFDFVNAGGRVFASHYHHYWVRAQPAWSPLMTFNIRQDLLTVTADINTQFNRGSNLANWLMDPAVSGSLTLGKLPLTLAQNTLQSVDTTKVQTWITVPASQNIQYVSFDTPTTATDAQKCGRFVLSDIHVSSSSDQAGPLSPFPTGCIGTGLSPQEKALIFLLFDLSSCIEPPIG